MAGVVCQVLEGMQQFAFTGETDCEGVACRSVEIIVREGGSYQELELKKVDLSWNGRCVSSDPSSDFIMKFNGV